VSVATGRGETGGQLRPCRGYRFCAERQRRGSDPRGAGTVGGRSSASPTFSGSLNFDQGTDGETPAIDFAGVGRTVPWATWYEDTSGAGFGDDNVFASRFDSSGANPNKWIFAGQGRGVGGGTVPVPSLNIHTDQSAENPSVAGGSTLDPTKPGPWVTWQETAASGTHPDQIFVEKPLGPGMTNCDGVRPQEVDDGSGHVPAIGGFCWQQVGIERIPVGSPTDPSLNVDPSRNGIEPDIAFTGLADVVPWVVWYETGNSADSSLASKELVFAAKGVADGAADGGFHWVAVGSAMSATLDTQRTSISGPTVGSDGRRRLDRNRAGCSGAQPGRSSSRTSSSWRWSSGTRSPSVRRTRWL
jgi:hypothetical protein